MSHLVIFPGAGDPQNARYTKVYDLLKFGAKTCTNPQFLGQYFRLGLV